MVKPVHIHHKVKARVHRPTVASDECHYHSPSVQATCEEMREYHDLEDREHARSNAAMKAAQRKAEEMQEKTEADIRQREAENAADAARESVQPPI